MESHGRNLYVLFGNHQESELQKAKDKAEFNQPVIRQEVINYSGDTANLL